MTTTTRQRIASTPLYDQWVNDLRSALTKRGARTELAKHMAARRDQSLAGWRITLRKVTHHGRMINSEDLLAISAWIAGRTLQMPIPASRTGRVCVVIHKKA